MRVLVTGATGYIGGRLVPRLLERGHRVRVLVRRPGAVAGRPWASRVEVATGDLLDPASLVAAMEGIDAAYYMVHSMTSGKGFEARDRDGARHFVAAGKALRLTVYLGGLLPRGPDVSAHLASRAEVGAILRDGLACTEFRAGPIIGAGSASFEMVRYLTERLPAMIAPRWILNAVHPICVLDVLDYLLAALERPALGVVEIGADALTFRQMMLEYAMVQGLRRLIVPVPVLAPWLAARWVGLVTPIPNALAVPLVEGVKLPLLIQDPRAGTLFPEIRPIPYRRAVELALERTQERDVETRWSNAWGGAGTPAAAMPQIDAASADGLTDWEGIIREVRSIHVPAAPEAVFRTFTALGGARGYLVWDWAWALRGLLDRVVGGPGLRRGRRDPEVLLAGEAMDFWRVEAVEPPTLLRLRAEMKVPGQAWLQWEARPEGEGTRLVQTASFIPRGLGGALYWYSLYPIHRFIFTDLVRAIGRASLTPANRPG